MDSFTKPQKINSRDYSPTYDFSSTGTQRSSSWGIFVNLQPPKLIGEYHTIEFCEFAFLEYYTFLRFTLCAGDVIRKCFGLDHRSLALYRVTIGMVIICDMMDRWKDMYVWYTDDGMLSRRVLTTTFWDPVNIFFIYIFYFLFLYLLNTLIDHA